MPRTITVLTLLASAFTARANTSLLNASTTDRIGYYSWNWGAGSTGPPDANMGVAFTGLIDVGSAIAGYTEGASWCCPVLAGPGMLSLGGGNSAGMFTVSALSDITTDMHAISEAGYGGVCFDVEETVGSSSELVPAFQKAFAAAKSSGLTVQVTTSHSAPYQADSASVAVDLVTAWCADGNIDEISPQLYSSGSETSPEFDATASCASEGCTWDLYENCTAKFVPSLVDPTHLAPTQSYFSSNFGIEVEGYYQWAQA